MSTPKTVIECKLRGSEIPCVICGHIPPDYCGQQDLFETPAEPVEAPEEDTGTDTPEDTEEAVSDAPTASTDASKGRKKRTVAA